MAFTIEPIYFNAHVLFRPVTGAKPHQRELLLSFETGPKGCDPSGCGFLVCHVRETNTLFQRDPGQDAGVIDIRIDLRTVARIPVQEADLRIVEAIELQDMRGSFLLRSVEQFFFNYVVRPFVEERPDRAFFGELFPDAGAWYRKNIPLYFPSAANREY